MPYQPQRLKFESIYSHFLTFPPWENKRLFYWLTAILEKSAIRAPRKILDIGCGNGKIAHTLEDNGFTVFGIDLARNAIKFSRDKYRLSKTFVADAAKLPFKDKSFDLVIDIGLLHCISPPNRHGIKEEIIRVTKKRGYYFISCFIRNNDVPYDEPIFYAYIHKKGVTKKQVSVTRQIPTWGLAIQDVKRIFKGDFVVERQYSFSDRHMVLLRKRR